MKKGKIQATNFVSHGSSYGQGSKSHQKDNKGKQSYEKKKSKKKEQWNKPKKSLFKENCKFCKKYGHKRADCFKFKKWLEQKRKGNPLALVCFESNNIDVPSNS